MSEISAFAAYAAQPKRKTATKGAANKKQQQNKTAARGGTATKNGKQGAANKKVTNNGTKSKATTIKKTNDAVSKTATKSAPKSQNGKTTTKAQNPKTGKTNPATAANKNKPQSSNGGIKNLAKTNSTAKATINKRGKIAQANGHCSTAKGTSKVGNARNIKSSDVDKLVEELYSKHESELTQTEKEKLKDLEAYLSEKLNKDERSTASMDFYTDEYTLSGSSTDDDYDESGEEESGEEESGEEESGEEESDEDESDEEGSEYTSTSDEDASSDYTDDEESSSSFAKVHAFVQNLLSAGNKRSSTNSSLTMNGVGKTEHKKAKVDPPTTSRKTLPAEMAKDKKVDSRRSLNIKDDKNGKTYICTANLCERRTSTAMSNPLKLEPSSPTSSITANSIEEGKKALAWLLNPITTNEFFNKYWEKNACLIKRKQQPSYYSHLISFEAIDQMLLEHHVEFTKNLDVTSYTNGVRETLNPEGRAMPPVVWDHYGNGCSIRLLNPQTFLPEIFSLNTQLQEYFHCMVGANAYLTPPNSQGFAPHYDDIEAFVIQIEGRKRWKLYSPRNQNELLPRYSSVNFQQQEIGKPILEEVLEPGDLLYFPRGTIHQASTEPGYHSLHITLSVYQKHSFADLLERLFPIVLQRAINSNVSLRAGLPLYTFQNAGIAFSEVDTKERSEFLEQVKKMIAICLQEAPLSDVVDAAVDQMAKKYQHEALPPKINIAERARTVFGSVSRPNERGEATCDYDIDLRTNVRVLRANIMRLIEEEGKTRIYFYLDNSKEYCEFEPNYIEIDPEEAGSIEVLIKSYPAYISVSQLPLTDDERKIQVITALWERGLLMLEKPFK